MCFLKEIKTAIENDCQLANCVYVAFSGGIDSHVLLHLCASSTVSQKITAVHVNHGLQKESAQWAEHSAEIARQLSVGFLVISVDARQKSGQSPEESARNARYQALSKLLNNNDLLLLGQHSDDQLETFLLQLFRGAGLSGLAAMPRQKGLGKGQILRPLLNISSQTIKAYAEEQQLHWIEDPSNLVNQFDRNFLRNDIVPLLKTRWPAVAKTVSRSARHCAQVQHFINEQSCNIFTKVYDPQDQSLQLSELEKLGDFEQSLVIRQWLQNFMQNLPSETGLRQIKQAVISARRDRCPKFQWQNQVIRRYDDKLYCLRDSPELDVLKRHIWPVGQTALKLEDNGMINVLPGSSGIGFEFWKNATQIEVRYRLGGEAIYLSDRKGKHKLKKLFQEARVPSWERDRIPLLFLDEKLAAVGNHWVCAEFFVAQGDALEFHWICNNA